jgi:phytoene synthase
MNLELEQLTPPKRLAIAYARADARPALALLLAFDVKLGRLFRDSSQPLIGQLRMAWWRDVIMKDLAARPAGEPVVAQLSALQCSHPQWDLGAYMTQLVDGWDALLSAEIWSDDVITLHIDVRAAAIFDGYAAMAGLAPSSDITAVGRRWALAELPQYCQTQDQFDRVAAMTVPGSVVAAFPRAIRPLTLLERAGRADASPARLFWHGLTGR